MNYQTLRSIPLTREGGDVVRTGSHWMAMRKARERASQRGVPQRVTVHKPLQCTWFVIQDKASEPCS